MIEGLFSSKIPLGAAQYWKFAALNVYFDEINALSWWNYAIQPSYRNTNLAYNGIRNVVPTLS